MIIGGKVVKIALFNGYANNAVSASIMMNQPWLGIATDITESGIVGAPYPTSGQSDTAAAMPNTYPPQPRGGRFKTAWVIVALVVIAMFKSCSGSEDSSQTQSIGEIKEARTLRMASSGNAEVSPSQVSAPLPAPKSIAVEAKRKKEVSKSKAAPVPEKDVSVESERPPSEDLPQEEMQTEVNLEKYRSLMRGL